MANISFADADLAAQVLNLKLGAQDWLLGIGVGVDEIGTHYVVVNSSVDNPANVPSVINGVPIKIKKRQMSVAL